MNVLDFDENYLSNISFNNSIQQLKKVAFLRNLT